MSDEWMTPLEVPMTREQFHRLPRNPAYRYEYLRGVAWVSAKPRFYHALLDLAMAPTAAASVTTLRPLVDSDWDALPPVFAAAFRDQPPFGTLEFEKRVAAAARSLNFTRNGGDGPWIAPASFVAEDSEGERIGAVLVTLLPDTDPTGWESFQWEEPPPEDFIARRLGRPHLTWIFVQPMAAGRGVGTGLLAAAAAALQELGYTEMASTFLLGNHSSMLWHWRQGFRLVSYPGSPRLPG
jgi:GNAT superfamily N-acetyltransferase